MWTSQLRPKFDDINRTGLDSQKGSAPPLECDLDLGHSGKFLRTGKVDQKDESWGHQGQGHTLKCLKDIY